MTPKPTASIKIVNPAGGMSPEFIAYLIALAAYIDALETRIAALEP